MREGLHVYAVGDFGPRDRWNPDFRITSLNAWPILRALSVEPASPRTLAERCGLSGCAVESVLSALADTGVVTCSGEKVHLGFAWFTASDQAVIHDGVTPAAQELAARIRARSREIDQHLSAVKALEWTDISDLRFAVVGCFGLDWGGLDALKESGHLEHDKAQPGGRRYVMYVEEPVNSYHQKDYTGSHSMWMSEAYRWTSFGDHSGFRSGLPDLIWRLGGAVKLSELLPEEWRGPLGDWVFDVVAAQLDTAADALAACAQGRQAPPVGHPLLEAAHALAPQRLAVPVFFWNEDGRAISRVVDIVKETLLATVSVHYGAFQRELGGLTALRHGVPFAECFNPIWHTLFGRANRILAEEGFLSDPAPRTPGEGRYRWWLTVY